MKQKVLYLYAELMGYQIPILKEYVKTFNCEVFVVHDIKNKKTKYIPPIIEGVTYYDKDSFKGNELKDFVLKLKPDIVYVSGWMYGDYLKAIYQLRKKKIPVVSGFDDIWFKTFRQRIASFIFPIIKKNFYSHAWIAGPYQYEYAKRLGFKNDEIIHNCLSADIDIFNKVFQNTSTRRQGNFPHRLLYVGRFEPIKGVDILVNAWNNLINSGLSKDWSLTLIGNGSLFSELKKQKSITIMDFLQPEQLVEVIGNYGCFVLPSRKEQWSLVLHEFSAAGMPIICSNICGALPVFVIPNYNGFVFKATDTDDLANQLIKIINLSDDQLIQMSENSHVLGQRITPEISASSFMSILN
jgi:glycosyltransferase involved in cell wall biosynthesis